MERLLIFLTETEQIVPFFQAKEMAQRGEVDSLTDIRDDGTWIIDDGAQHQKGFNLDDLPEF
jgi:hypothetical protein